MEGLQGAAQELAILSDADVVINDFSVFDQWVGLSPYLIIGSSDQFEARRDSSAAQTTWTIGATLIEQFVDWKTSLDNLRDHRQLIINKWNADDHRTAGGLSGVDVRVIRSETPILPWFYPYQENTQETFPVFLYQDWGIDVEEF